jgi:tripartite ATP-independent transporter DctM subunit
VSTTILILSFFVLVLIGVPICFSLGASAIIYLLIHSPDFLITLPQRIWAGSESFVLIALPLFIMAGELMNRGGITQRLIDFSLYIVRPIRGGLGEVNVVASMIFGGISGSSVADTSAIGTVLIPTMVEHGYDEGFSVGVTVASSTMGMIIPPSIPMLIYAMVSEQSVGALFLAGMIPGLLVGITQIALVYFISKRRRYHPVAEKFDLTHFLATTRNGLLALVMPLVIVVSVSFGIATASESAGIAVLYALILGFFIYRELKLKDIGQVLKKMVLASSSIMFVIAYSMIFIWILAMEQVPTKLGMFVQGLDVHRFWILLALDLFILLVGTFIDVGSAIILVGPLLIHVMGGIGMSPLQLGAILIVGLAIGLVTPPVGACLFACTKICGMPVMKIAKHALPFLVCNVIILLLVTFVPAVSLWLPGLIMR